MREESIFNGWVGSAELPDMWSQGWIAGTRRKKRQKLEKITPTQQ